MTAPLTDKKDLVFLRVGDTSTHRDWIRRPGDPLLRRVARLLRRLRRPVAVAGDAAHLTDGPNTNKFGRIVALLPELTRYEAIWFPDDDIRCDPAGVERLFDVFRRRNMLLAQPSLADGSYVAHEITRWNGSVEVRFTNFVEAMCPLFSRDALRIPRSVVPGGTLRLRARHDLADDAGEPARPDWDCIDAAPVVHSRPIGGGTWRAAGRPGSPG